jgi:hypothetical protein
MKAKPDSLAIIQSRAALRRWCILAGLALAPLPAIHAAPEAFFYFVFESPLPIWTRMTMREPYWFTLLGLPIAAIFLAWSLPGAGRPGLPMRSIVVLFILVAYNPVRHFIEIHYYGDAAARVAALDWAWIAGGIIRNLDTPLLIGLAATALIRRHTLRPIPKILFHWVLFVCALWAASHPYDSMVTEILLFRAFGI